MTGYPTGPDLHKGKNFPWGYQTLSRGKINAFNESGLMSVLITMGLEYPHASNISKYLLNWCIVGFILYGEGEKLSLIHYHIPIHNS